MSEHITTGTDGDDTAGTSGAEEGPVLRFEVSMDPDWRARVVRHQPCSRDDLRDICLRIAYGCQFGDLEVPALTMIRAT